MHNQKSGAPFICQRDKVIPVSSKSVSWHVLDKFYSRHNRRYLWGGGGCFSFETDLLDTGMTLSRWQMKGPLDFWLCMRTDISCTDINGTGPHLYWKHWVPRNRRHHRILQGIFHWWIVWCIFTSIHTCFTIQEGEFFAQPWLRDTGDLVFFFCVGSFRWLCQKRYLSISYHKGKWYFYLHINNLMPYNKHNSLYEVAPQ